MADLLKAYLKYAYSKNFRPEILGQTESSFTVKIDGKGAHDAFAREAGKHVVQRVPPTERHGRRHTSVVSVAVMPFPAEVDCEAELEDVVITTQRGHGKGGQHQNKTDSAVRAVHRPSGITVFINGRKQHDNKRLALSIMRQRIFNWKAATARSTMDATRFRQLGGGDRSDKIRTYSFIDGFVIDHRNGTRTNKIHAIMKGEFDILR